MLGKVALRNIRRSVKDYAIYFVTLLMAVTLFYAFNSISEQQVMTEINESSHMDVSQFVGEMVSLFSYIIAFVLAFLIIYANSLLIRRRKREFGMYFMLGMRPIQVSRIIIYETVLVGVISLALGLGLGVLVSQLLSFATAAIFGIALPDYQFSFSMDACIMTLVCFCVIFFVVAVFNVFSIRRCKLIDLMNADSQSEKVAVRNPWVCLVLFIVSIGLLAAAYWQLKINGMTMLMDDNFKAATILMDSPWQIATAKASMERPTATKNSSNKPIFSTSKLFFGVFPRMKKDSRKTPYPMSGQAFSMSLVFSGNTRSNDQRVDIAAASFRSQQTTPPGKAPKAKTAPAHCALHYIPGDGGKSRQT